MGTVVEKIRYIAGTKSAIRSAILKKGVEVGEEVTFRAYAEKIAEIEGGQSAAAYVFENSTQDREFPLNALTSDKVQTYQDDESLKTWLETPTKDPAYMVLAADNINAFDKNVETYTGNYKIVWKFPTAVKARSFKTKVTNGYDNWRLYGSNNPLSVYNAWTGREYSDETGELLINTAERYQVLSEVTLSPKQPYQYYILTGAENGSCDLYEASLLATSGTVSCSLAEGNMTPTIRVYLEDYMQLITQPFYCEGKVIPSQTLVMKPYEEGGNLINYTDDGSAVDLKIFYGKSGGEPASKKYVQPLLSANGTLGGNDPACSGTSEQTPAYYAFDGNTETKWQTGTSSTPQSVVFYDPDGFVPTGAVISFVNGEVYASGEVFGSNDNSDWVSLTTFADNELDTLTLSFANDTEYKYIKFQFNSLFSGWGQIYEIKINGVVRRVPADMYFIAPNADSLPEGYVSAQIVADLSLPAHIYKNAGGEWVMGKTD